MYRGDLIRNESDELVLYADTATTPTALVALNLALFYEHVRTTPFHCRMPFRHSFRHLSKKRHGSWYLLSCGWIVGKPHIPEVPNWL